MLGIAFLAAIAANTPAAFRDECSALPGFGDFRARLQAAVAARDGEAFRALFHPDGAMRVEGIGGRANYPDWGFGRPGAKLVWEQLDQILQLGCVREGERLLMPAMAGLGTVEPGQLIVLRDTEIRTGPGGGGPVLRVASQGEVLTQSVYDQPPGWTEVLVDGGSAFVLTAAIRSPFSYQLALVAYEGGWRIREFSDGV